MTDATTTSESTKSDTRRRGAWIVPQRLMVGVLIIAALADGAYELLWVPYQQQRFLDNLRERGATIVAESSARYDTVTHADLSRVEEFDDDDLARLVLHSKLRYLNLSGTRVTDAGLAQLADCKPLVSLDLSRTAISDGGLLYLYAIERLMRLNLAGTSITDEGLQHVKHFGFLTCLNLSKTKVTDVGIGHLSGENGLHELAALWLDDTKVTGAFKVYVPCLSLAGTQVKTVNLPQIDAWVLDLARTPVDDEAVPHLMERSWLNLDGTQVTDVGLRQLASSTKLKSISLENTGVSDQAIADFTDQAPQCRVVKGDYPESIPKTDPANLQFCDGLISQTLFRSSASRIDFLMREPDDVAEPENIATYHIGAFDVAVDRNVDAVIVVRLRPVCL